MCATGVFNHAQGRNVIVYSIVFFSSRRRHTRYWRDWSSDVCSSDLKDGCGIDIHRSGKQPATFYWNEEKLCWMAGISGKEQKIATFNFGKDGEKGKATGSKILFICIDSNKIYFDNDIDNWLQVGGSDSIK